MFRPIPNFPGYFAGDDGHIYSTRRHTEPRRLAEGSNRDGYPTVQLTYDDKSRTYQVHSLVAAAFLPEREGPVEVRHLDGSRTNNAPSNLAWGTRKENADDREKHGRTARGEANGGGNKLTEAQVFSIKRLLAEGRSTYSIADEFGVSQGLIWFIKSGRKWSHVE